MRRPFLAALLATALATPALAQDAPFSVEGSAGTQLTATPRDAFNAPWAMTFLPDGRLLVTEKGGALVLVSAEGKRLGMIDGVPDVRPAGQGGLGDVVLHPDFAQNGLVYLSYVERDGDLSGAVVDRARLDLTDAGGALGERTRIWTQDPKVTGNGHYSHRIAFGPDGKLFITSGERQKMTPAQDMSVNLGKVVRLNEDGSVPDDNPHAGEGGVTAQVWTSGHRNLLGIDVAPDGTLWTHEMGPRGGDEINRIVEGENYGWPEVSDGRHYSGLPIPDHDTDASFKAPAISWVPSVSPAGLVIYDGDLFADWQGDAVLGALSGQALLHVALDDDTADEVERFTWGARVREVEQGPDGAIWVLEDGPGGRLITLRPS